MPAPHQTGRFPSGDVQIFYRLLNRGQTTFSGKRGLTPILFVHGLSFFSWDWVDVAAALGAGREAVCIDQRGFGDSGWSAAGDYSVPSMALDLANLMDHLGWARAVLAGHSMGGRSAAYLAATQPARAAALVLVDYSPDNAPEGSARVAQSVAATPDAFASIDEAMRYFKAGPGQRARFEAYLRPVEGGYALKRDPHFRDQFRKLLASGERPKLGVDMWRTLADVRCPALAIRGARSDLFARETVAKLEAANPRIRVAEVDAGHNVAGDNPQGLVAALAPFLASLEETDHEHARH